MMLCTPYHLNDGQYHRTTLFLCNKNYIQGKVCVATNKYIMYEVEDLEYVVLTTTLAPPVIC